MTTFSAARSAAIWGFGREGAATLEFLRDHHPTLPVTILLDDPSPDLPNSVPRLVGHDAMTALRSGCFDVVVKSPGVSLYRDEIRAARQHGSRFTSGTNIWFETHPKAVTIVVTGTKGKSTTARLLQYLLSTCALDTVLLGNVGIPALGQEPGKDLTVLELSSYQIADLQFPPSYAVLTNLYPEHAPWHGGPEQYYRDKTSVARIGAETHVLCNHADHRLRDMFSEEPGVGWFNTATGFRAQDRRLWFADQPVELLDSPLRGEHNLSNLAAACTIADWVSPRRFRERVSLADFRQLPHRLQERRLSPDLLCVNDSLSTVPEAVVAAISSFPGIPIVLIVGGADRGQDYRAMIEFVSSSSVVALILLPVTGDRIWDAARDRISRCEVERVPDLDTAVQRALSLVPSPGLVLLSPGAPSFGQFKDYAERGDRFMSLCETYGSSS